MDFAGAAFSIAPLIQTCQKIVSILRNVGQKFKRAPLMMTSIAAECTLIIGALEHLGNFDWSELDSEEDGRFEQMTRSAETIILGCTLSLSVIEEYASELQEYVEGSKLSPTEQMGIMARVRVLWKEDEMRELLLQLRGYQTALTNLLRAAHDDDDESAISNVLQSLKSLIARSRTSRSRKPLSIRSAMQQSAAYANLARGPPAGAQNLMAKASMASATGSTRGYNSGQGISAATADLFDRATSATASKDPISGSRKKKPTVLAMNTENDNNPPPTRYISRDREHLRKSSPTVGETFNFIKGQEEEAGNVNGIDVGTTLAEPVDEESEEEEDEEAEEEAEEDDEDEEEESEEEEEMEEHLEDPPIPPPGMPERLDPITEESSPKPKKQKSTSSVRSQIINLPEAARLRKQASGELARQREMRTSPTPSFSQLKGASGNQTTAQDLLARRRASELTHRHQHSDPSALALRYRGHTGHNGHTGRASSQDIRVHPIVPLPYSQDRNIAAPFVSSPNLNGPMSPSLMSPSYPGPDDAWPLTPDMPTIPVDFPTGHARSMSQDPSQLRSMSPEDPTPKASRTNTPLFSNTPHRGRSRSNTAATGDEPIYGQLDDSASIAGSVAPSMMSAQWFKTPRERLGLGSRIRADQPVQWEQLDHRNELEDYPTQPTHRHTLSQQSMRGPNGNQRSRKVQLFTIYPPKSPPPMAPPDPPPPRSPLLTETFLHDVGGVLDSSIAGRVSIDIPPQHQAQSQVPTRSLSFRGLTKRRDRSKEGDKDREPEKSSRPSVPRKKESRFPTFNELVTEYKSLANKWHTSQEDDGSDDERRSRNPYQRPVTSQAMMGHSSAAMSNMSLNQPVARSQSTQPMTGSGSLVTKLARDVDTPSRLSTKSAIPVPSSTGKSKSSRGLKSETSSKSDRKKKLSLFAEVR